MRSYSNAFLSLSLLLLLSLVLSTRSASTLAASSSDSTSMDHVSEASDDADVDLDVAYYTYDDAVNQQSADSNETAELENELLDNDELQNELMAIMTEEASSSQKPSMRGSVSISASSSDASSSSSFDNNSDADDGGDDGDAGDSTAPAVATEKKVRRHQLVRRGRGRGRAERNTQQCNIQCFSNFDCASWGNSFTNCRQFNICSNGRCLSSSQPRCGQFCQNNPSICNGASDGCSVCTGGTCSSGGFRGFQNKCGWNCSNNFNICNDSSNGCTECNGSTCQSGGNRSGGFGNQRCGQFCRNNANICKDSTDGCVYCNGSTGTCFSGGFTTRSCNSSCFSNNDCASAVNGCNQCLGGTCQGNRSGVIGGVSGGACVANESVLRQRLEGGGIVELCANANIVLNSEITTNRSNIQLRCVGGGTGCTIRGNGRNRLLRFTGSNISLTGITFQRGGTTGSGGAIMIDGNNNRITNCKFFSNRASQRGGAGTVGSTTFAGNTFAGNVGGQCSNFFQKQTNQCFG